jgi:hypothetical protein
MMNILCGAVVVGGGTTMFLICPAMNFLVDGGSAVAAHWRQSSSSGQPGVSVGSAAVVALERWQHGGGSTAMAALRWWPCGRSVAAGSVAAVSASAAAAWQWAAWRQCWQRGSGGIGSTPAAASLAAAAEVWWRCSVSGGSREAGAALPPHAATVATKTPAATAMAGALPTINNQLKAAAAMAMEMMTTMTN